MWNKITVEQFQEISAIQKDKSLSEEDKLIQTICTLFDLTETQVDDLPLKRWQTYVNAATIALSNFPDTKPAQRIKAGKRLYRMNYDIGNIRLAQYSEVDNWLHGGIIENLHRLAASIASPLHLWMIPGKNRSEDHKKVANDFLQANFVKTYNSVVFFCKARKAMLSNGGDYSTFQKMQTKAEKEIRRIPNQLQIALPSNTDGSIQPPK